MAAIKAVLKAVHKVVVTKAAAAVGAEAIPGVLATTKAVMARAASVRVPLAVWVGSLALYSLVGTLVVVLEARAAVSAEILAEIIPRASLRRVRAVPLVAGWAGAVMPAGERAEPSAVPARRQLLAGQAPLTVPVVLAVRPHPPGALAGLADPAGHH